MRFALLALASGALAAPTAPDSYFSVGRIATSHSPSTWLYKVRQEHPFALDLRNVLEVDSHMQALKEVFMQFDPPSAGAWLALDINNRTLNGRPHLAGNGTDVYVTFHARWKGQWHDSFALVHLYRSEQGIFGDQKRNSMAAAIAIILSVALLFALAGGYACYHRRKEGRGFTWSRPRILGQRKPSVKKARSDIHSLGSLSTLVERPPPPAAASDDSVRAQAGGAVGTDTQRVARAPHVPEPGAVSAWRESIEAELEACHTRVDSETHRARLSVVPEEREGDIGQHRLSVASPHKPVVDKEELTIPPLAEPAPALTRDAVSGGR
jgi:hypothetical protein